MATMISEVYNAFLAGGTPEAEARKATEALSAESLGTKGDIAETEGKLTGNIAAVAQKLTRKIAATEEKLNGKIDEVREALTRKIDAVKAELNDKIDGLRSDIVKLDRDMAMMKSLLLIILSRAGDTAVEGPLGDLRKL